MFFQITSKLDQPTLMNMWNNGCSRNCPKKNYMYMFLLIRRSWFPHSGSQGWARESIYKNRQPKQTKWWVVNTTPTDNHCFTFSSKFVGRFWYDLKNIDIFNNSVKPFPKPTYCWIYKFRLTHFFMLVALNPPWVMAVLGHVGLLETRIQQSACAKNKGPL